MPCRRRPRWSSAQFPRRLRRQRYLTAELGRFKRGLLGLMRRVTGRLPRTPRDLMAQAECLHVVGEREMETSGDLLERALPPTGLDPDQALEMVRQHEPAGVYSATTFVTMARPSGLVDIPTTARSLASSLSDTQTGVSSYTAYSPPL